MSRRPGVTVVGGGLAGCAAVIALGQHGLETTWLAGPDRPPTPYGESLATAARPILVSLGLGALLDDPRHRPSNAMFSSWGSAALMERNAALYLEGPGLVLDRPAFEAEVVSSARQVAEPVARSAVGIAPVDREWSLTLDDGTTHRTQFIVDATGRSASISRRLSHRIRGPRLVAAVTVAAQGPSDAEPTRATLIEAMPDGWIYAALLADDRLSLAYFTSPSDMPINIMRDADAWRTTILASTHVSYWIEDAGFEVPLPTAVRDAGVSWLEAASGVGPHGRCGWAAIGDAAAAFDPLSSHGMTTALWTGERMGAIAARFFESDQVPLHRYSTAVSKGVRDFLQARRRMYAQETRFSERPFWRTAIGS